MELDRMKELLSLRVARFFQWMFLVLLLGMAIALFGLNFPIFDKDQMVVVSSAKDHQVYGRMYQGTKNLGVLIVGDLDEDQMALKAIAQEFYGSGANVMTLDYSGHGLSRSDVNLDWLASDGLTGEIRSGLELFKRQTGLEDSNIVVVGHGFGARGLLQLIVEDKPAFMGASLVSPDIALDGKGSGSRYFNGRDDRSTGWINSLGSASVAIPLQLVATRSDGTVSAESATLLYQRLTGSTAKLSEDPQTGLSTAASEKIWLTLIEEETVLPADAAITDKLLHPIESFDRSVGQLHRYQLCSNTVITVVKDWVRSKAGMRSVSSTTLFPMARVICWYLAAVGLFFVSLFSMILAWRRYPAPDEDSCGITLYKWRALVIRLALWLPALAVALALWLILKLLPLGRPLGLTLPAALFGGYGLVTLLLYAFRRMPGTRGQLRLIGGALSFWRTMTSVLMMAGLGCYTAFLGYSGLYLNWIAGHQTAWMVVLILVLAIGFYSAELECDILTDNGGNFWMCILYRLLVFLPVAACCLLQGIMSINIIVALAVAFQFSGAFRRHSGGRLIPAVGSAALFCMMVVPCAVIAV